APGAAAFPASVPLPPAAVRPTRLSLPLTSCPGRRDPGRRGLGEEAPRHGEGGGRARSPSPELQNSPVAAPRAPARPSVQPPAPASLSLSLWALSATPHPAAPGENVGASGFHHHLPHHLCRTAVCRHHRQCLVGRRRVFCRRLESVCQQHELYRNRRELSGLPHDAGGPGHHDPVHHSLLHRLPHLCAPTLPPQAGREVRADLHHPAHVMPLCHDCGFHIYRPA
ncbi:unnamed protein product, partial [Gulo gulo]